jgi:hypothetical protein
MQVQHIQNLQKYGKRLPRFHIETKRICSGNNMGKPSHLKNLPTLFNPVRIKAPSQNAVFYLKKT